MQRRDRIHSSAEGNYACGLVSYGESGTIEYFEI